MGLTKKPMLVGFLLGVLFLLGCAAFPYKYYGLDAKSYDGMLRGPTDKDDIPLAVCTPDAQNKGKCFVMLAADYLLLKKEYKNLINQLAACQHGK